MMDVGPRLVHVESPTWRRRGEGQRNGELVLLLDFQLHRRGISFLGHRDHRLHSRG